MKISYTWLCEIIPGLSQISPHDLATKLTFSGLEVEAIEDQAERFNGIVVGEVVHREKHPNADKLSLCRVKAGDEEFQVVCGAPNVQAGKKYPFATLGTKMPDGLEIKPVKLRGVESFGMLCSARELQFDGDHSGLLELDDQFTSGLPISLVFGKNDFLFEINITPNRGDALSHWGVARDVAAITGLKVNTDIVMPKHVDHFVRANKRVKTTLSVDVKDPLACGRFTGSQIFNVTVKPSPAWLQHRLEALGLRPINNIVDLTNYVMLLTGHPVHAYDERDISGQKIVVRTLDKEETFKTLDEIDRKLQAGDIVIADAKRVVGLAGIMGGENSQIKEDTKNVILEVAFFDPVMIRKTAKRLGLQTDSSYRFERFVNPDSVLKAHQILQALILLLAGGEATEITDAYPQPFKPVTLELPASEITRMLGISVPQDDVTRILTGLGCDCSCRREAYHVTVPLSRSDLTRPIDLIEEVARLYGLDKIPAVMPTPSTRYAVEADVVRVEREVKELLVAHGFTETVHYSFCDEKELVSVLKPLSQDDWMKLKNPISEEMGVMRTSLLPQLISCYKKNKLNTQNGLRLFELRRVYFSQNEKTVLAGLYTGNPYGRNRFGLNREADFADGKGVLESIFGLGRVSITEKTHEQWPFHPGQSIEIVRSGQRLATLGALHPQLLVEQKITDRLYYFEIDFDFLSENFKKEPIKYHAVSVLPAVYRDLAIVVPKNVTHADILRTIDEEKSPLLKHVELFDLYEGNQVEEGKKSLAYSMVYEPDVGADLASAHSLTDEEVNKAHFSLVERLEKKLGVKLR